MSLAALLLGATTGCGDDASATEGGGSTGVEDTSGANTFTELPSTGGVDPDPTGVSGSSTSAADDDTGAHADDGSSGSSSTGTPGSFPELPTVLSLSGCEEIELGPLCSVTQEDGAFTANCGGVAYTGTITESGDITLTTESWTNADGAEVSLSCEGTFWRGRLSAGCTQATAAAGDIPPTEATCDLASDGSILPGVTCMELPPVLESLVICEEGADQGGTTLEAGNCSVIQDGCSFQAECENDVVLTGTVGVSDLSFSRMLPALADAETPEGGEPAFLAGTEVEHDCTATLSGTAVAGSCGAGAAGRRGTDTSVCAIGGSAEPVPACDPLAPGEGEFLFVLDSCPMLKDGEGEGPGIGEPVCALRQNNCIWEVQCGADLLYAGRVEPGSDTAQWRLATGTPCELTVDDDGQVSGSCTVPGEEACELSSMEPETDEANCPVLPEGTIWNSRGCGPEGSLGCRVALQHGCDFTAICGFARFDSVVIAGVSSYESERGHLEFNGAPGWQCYVDEATAEDVSSGDRADNEWYGQCVNETGGMCRDNYDPTTGEGYRGLQVFFGEIPTPDPEAGA